MEFNFDKTFMSGAFGQQTFDSVKPFVYNQAKPTQEVSKATQPYNISINVLFTLKDLTTYQTKILLQSDCDENTYHDIKLFLSFWCLLGTIKPYRLGGVLKESSSADMTRCNVDTIGLFYWRSVIDNILDRKTVSKKVHVDIPSDIMPNLKSREMRLISIDLHHEDFCETMTFDNLVFNKNNNK